MTEIILDNFLTITPDDFPGEAIVAIKDELTFPNQERLDAIKEKRWGWQKMPEHISLFVDVGDKLILPRGYAHTLMAGMREVGLDFDLLDRRTGEVDPIDSEPIRLRLHQESAVEALLREESGIYQAPPGSGKTVAVLETIRRAGMARNIILVDKINLVDQWKERCGQFLGIEAGVIGDGEWQEKQITVATVQTLYQNLSQLDEMNWWERWGLMCLDECHHQTARTFQEVVSRFLSKYRLGVSGTPKKTGAFDYALAVLGDIVHVTTRDELRSTGVLVQPTIVIVESDFEYPYHGTFTTPANKDCGIEGCPKAKKKRHLHRSNYTQMQGELVKYAPRNDLIARIAQGNRNHHNLVLSSRLNHLDTLRSLCIEKGWPEEIAYTLTGKESRAERAEIIELISGSEESITFSTIADEALDVPALDRLYLCFPGSNVDATRQRIGRVERTHRNKRDSLVYYITDPLIGVLRNQANKMRWDVFQQEQYPVTYYEEIEEP